MAQKKHSFHHGKKYQRDFLRRICPPRFQALQNKVQPLSAQHSQNPQALDAGMHWKYARVATLEHSSARPGWILIAELSVSCQPIFPLYRARLPAEKRGLSVELRIEPHNRVAYLILFLHAHRDSFASVQHCSAPKSASVL